MWLKPIFACGWPAHLCPCVCGDYQFRMRLAQPHAKNLRKDALSHVVHQPSPEGASFASGTRLQPIGGLIQKNQICSSVYIYL